MTSHPPISAARYLKAGAYTNFVTETDAREVVERIRSTRPDVVLLDVMMPYVDGLTILDQVRLDPQLRFIPVVIVTASDDAETKVRALELGATDFLSKPVDPNELLPRVRNALMVKAYQDHLEDQSEELERQVRERTAKLEASRMHVMHCLARAGEYRDDLTGHHVIRVGLYSGVIAREIGIDEDRAQMIEQAAQLHDVGKIGIPDAILHKPGKLTAEEFDAMKKHCDMGMDIITAKFSGGGRGSAGRRAAMAEVAESPALMMAAMIAQTHHEKWDGSGYPLGLDGERIPVEGRIVAIADVYDALRSERPYKEGFPREKCLDIITEGRGSHFDPTMVDAFLARIDRIVEIERQYDDGVSAFGQAA